MNFKAVFVMICCFLFVMASTNVDENPQWKGKIEYEDGVKIVQNPRNPLYGEIAFDLQEDLSIGRSGQGPGEFEHPTLVRVDSSYGKIYVKDMDFFPFEDDTILAILLKSSDEELTNVHILCRLDDQGKILDSFAGYPYTGLKRRVSTGAILSTSTGYELAMHMAALDQGMFVYGYSKEYELNVMNGEGKLLCRIRMDQPRPHFTSEEQSEYKRLKFPVPEFKPYFFFIFSDTKGRIYVQRNKTQEGIRGYGPIDTAEKEIDIFSPDGYYLYRTSLPPNTSIIKNGFLYTRELDEDEGMEYVKRYKIKNWEQIKEGQ
jgi:hypothetical protein